MTLSEKSAYLKGLMEGMKLDTETNEGKLISEIISMLQDVAENVSDLEEVVGEEMAEGKENGKEGE